MAGITAGKKVQIACRFEQDVFDRLDANAQEYGYPIAHFIRELVSLALERRITIKPCGTLTMHDD